MKSVVSDWIRLSRRIEDTLYTMDAGTALQAVVALQFCAEGLLQGDPTHPSRTVEFITAARQTREEFDRYATAYHEAAHAVIGARRGHRVIRLSVGMEPVKDLVARGVCEFKEQIAPNCAADAAGWQAVEDYIVMTLAGPIAQGRVSQPGSEVVAEQVAYHRTNSLEVAGRIQPRVLDDRLEGYLDRLTATAATEVAEHWGTIRTVAAALLKNNRLDEAAFYSLINPRTPTTVTRLTDHDACCVHAGPCAAGAA